MISRIALPAAALVFVASVAFAQPPEASSQPPQQERNLKVLPAYIPRDRLINIMRHFAQALGVQCGFCHVAGDFRSDANPHKDIARGMIRMTRRINEEVLPPVIGPSQEVRVTCYTCHRGSSEPVTDLPPAPGAPAAAPRQPEPPHHHPGERG